MLAYETELILKVKAYFGLGSVVINKDGSIEYIVRDLANHLLIRDHFLNLKKIPFKGTKRMDFLSFKRAPLRVPCKGEIFLENEDS